jgi:hypothetical protein
VVLTGRIVPRLSVEFAKPKFHGICVQLHEIEKKKDGNFIRSGRGKHRLTHIDQERFWWHSS